MRPPAQFYICAEFPVMDFKTSDAAPSLPPPFVREMALARVKREFLGTI